MESWMWVVWLAIFALTMIIEVSVSGLVSIWISLAALITLALSFIPNLPYWGEIIIFVVVSLILLASTRPVVKKILKNKEEIKTNTQSLIGQKIVLIKTVEEFSVGEAKINGVVWDCKSYDDSVIEKGKIVEIIKIDGNKLIVKEVKE